MLKPFTPKNLFSSSDTKDLLENMESIRKRARTSFTETQEPTTASSSQRSIPSSYKNPTSQHLLNEIDKLKAELSKEKSQRKLDKIQAENSEKRLNRHILFLEQNAKDANDLAEEIRKQSDNTQEDLMAKISQAVSDREKWENKYWDLKEDSAESDELENDLSLAVRKNQLLQEKVKDMGDEMSSLKHQLASAATVGSKHSALDVIDSSDDEADLAVHRAKDTATTTPTKSKSCTQNAISPAPPAVLTELNRTRISLAESERSNRQMSRKIEELQSKADEMIKYRETALSSNRKIEQLERDLKMLRREREAVRIIESRWEDFRRELVNHGIGAEIINGPVDENVPPEIATVVRHFRSLEKKVEELELAQTSNRTQLDAAQRQQNFLEEKNKKQDMEYEKVASETKSMREKLQQNEMELNIIKAREKVWNRESESMRSLLDTYEKMERNIATRNANNKNTDEANKTRTGSDVSAQALQLSLSTAQDEIKLLKEQFDKAKSEIDAIENERKELKEEHEKVRKKFGQLREALYQERAKAEKADERAFKAETIAGKGAYNDETIRVMHLKDNPLSNAIREKFQREIEVLKSALQTREAELTDVTSGSKAGKAQLLANKRELNQSSNLDAQKFNKRLKDQFREQIGLFREGVYLITGYKIDMNIDKGSSDNIRFKVRSIFAEREKDHLDLLWRKDKDGNRASSLDILETDLAQQLTKEDAFDYMKKYKSLPAFMAGVCLTLFEKQTLVL